MSQNQLLWAREGFEYLWTREQTDLLQGQQTTTHGPNIACHLVFYIGTQPWSFVYLLSKAAFKQQGLTQVGVRDRMAAKPKLPSGPLQEAYQPLVYWILAPDFSHLFSHLLGKSRRLFSIEVRLSCKTCLGHWNVGKVLVKVLKLHLKNSG